MAHGVPRAAMSAWPSLGGRVAAPQGPQAACRCARLARRAAIVRRARKTKAGAPVARVIGSYATAARLHQ
ncbi:hypothetical protein [Lysobacter gummosus]|uniref:hypothetical protein n=1 Tax=Lysobacter gummosus TaxID=262324 RepID=UPI00362F207E